MTKNKELKICRPREGGDLLAKALCHIKNRFPPLRERQYYFLGLTQNPEVNALDLISTVSEQVY